MCTRSPARKPAANSARASAPVVAPVGPPARRSGRAKRTRARASPSGVGVRGRRTGGSRFCSSMRSDLRVTGSRASAARAVTARGIDVREDAREAGRVRSSRARSARGSARRAARARGASRIAGFQRVEVSSGIGLRLARSRRWRLRQPALAPAVVLDVAEALAAAPSTARGRTPSRPRSARSSLRRRRPSRRGRSRGCSRSRRSAAPPWCSARRAGSDTPSFWFRSRTISKISSTSCGARPIDGSSSRIIFGRAISARPIAVICCSPPEV